MPCSSDVEKFQSFLQWLDRKGYKTCTYDDYGGMFTCGYYPAEVPEILIAEWLEGYERVQKQIEELKDKAQRAGIV